jgi:hypothetical protein
MSKPESEMRPEYDFSDGVRGKYAARFEQGSNVVVLPPDLTAEFPTPQDVHAALRRVARGRARRRRAAAETAR